MRRLEKHPAGARLVIGLVLLMTGTLAAQARAGTANFDAQMKPVLEAYLPIPKVLAADSTRGVTDAAEKIEKLAGKLDPSSVTGKHARHYKNVPAKLEAAARKMAGATDIATMREGLKELSKPMAMWATMSEPEGISVVYCSMARGSWLQRGTRIHNPYHGARMPHCGEIVAGEGAKKPGTENR